MSDKGYPKNNRLRTKREFDKVYKEGTRVKFNQGSFYLRKKENSTPRLAFVAPGSIGTAVERNRVKRVVREVFRKNKERFKHWDIILILNTQTLKLNNDKLRQTFLDEFEKATRKLEVKENGNK